MQRNLVVFYAATSSLAGLVACMLYPSFWKPLIVVAITSVVTFRLLAGRRRKTYVFWLSGLGIASAVVAALFGHNGKELSPLGSALGLALGFIAICIAWRLFRSESERESST